MGILNMFRRGNGRGGREGREGEEVGGNGGADAAGDIASQILAIARGSRSNSNRKGGEGAQESGVERILQKLSDGGLVEGIRVDGGAVGPRMVTGMVTKETREIKETRPNPVKIVEGARTARIDRNERRAKWWDAAEETGSEESTLEAMGSMPVEDIAETVDTGEKGETVKAAKTTKTAGAKAAKGTGTDEIERKSFDTVRVVRDKKKEVMERRASDMAASHSRDNMEDDIQDTGVTVLHDVVADHLVDFLMDPLDKNLPLVTILPGHALTPIVSAETMATLPYRYYIGRNDARREKAIMVARRFSAPLFLIRRRDLRSIGVKGQGRADGVSMFQTKVQEQSANKPLFPTND